MSAVASTWLSEEIGNKFKFFVDEDDARIGKKNLGKKIISPEEMSEEDILYIGLIPIIAKKISQNLKDLNSRLSYHLILVIERIKIEAILCSKCMG